MKRAEPNKNQILFMTLQGRLGNQLFIYFAAKYFEEKYMKKVVFISDSRDRLNHVGIKSNNSKIILPKYWFKLFNMVLSKLSLLKSAGMYIHFCENVGFEDLSHKINRVKILNGHFQTSYFIENSIISDSILSDIRIYLNSKFISHSNYTFDRAIAIHIRRGDYLLEKNNYFGILSDDYYIRSISTLSSFTACSKIYLFSDSRISIDFKGKIESNFKNMEIIDVNQLDLDDISTLAIMIRCSSYIISNSTYSWWGAYLGDSNKIVTAPSIWFKNHQDPEKIYPSTWQTIKSAWV